MPPARGEPICREEDCCPYDIGLVFTNMTSFSRQDKFRFLGECVETNPRGQSTMANHVSLTCRG